MAESIHDQLWSGLESQRKYWWSHMSVRMAMRSDLYLSIGLGLRGLGKQVQMVLADGVPASFRHLLGAELIQKKADGEVDLVVSVDCSDIKRLGNA